MPTRPPRERVSVEDYLQGELISEVRHEYLGGEIYAMVGASDRHNLITGNLFAALRPLVRGTPCQVFVSDMKVRLNVAGEDVFYYPDLVLSCDPQDRATYYRNRPCLIVEVLSEATARLDRREKLLAYTSIESLQEYLLLSQDRREAELHRRRDGWRVTRFTEGAVPLACLDTEIALATLYEDVGLP
jgi:Uma2 family endonuclease